MRTKYHGLRLAMLSVVAAFYAAPGAASTLALDPKYPDVTTFNSSISYVATCENDNFFTGTCGESGGGGGNAAKKLLDVQTSGLFKITGSTMSINIDGSGSIPITGGSYLLQANFSSTGTFVAAGSTISISGSTTDPNFSGPNILTANLTAFGFSGANGVGVFEFKFDNSVAGNMAAYYTNGISGVIASTTSMVTGSSHNAQWTSGNWDPSNNNNPNFFLRRSFTATSNVDTFVPVPAAVWLFGSGLLGLVGVARRSRLDARS